MSDDDDDRKVPAHGVLMVRTSCARAQAATARTVKVQAKRENMLGSTRKGEGQKTKREIRGKVE